MVGVGELAASAAVGLLFTELYKGVEKRIGKSNQFKTELNNIKSTLDSLQPAIKQIQDHNTKLGLSNKEIESFKMKISEGAKLVNNFSKIRMWNSVEYTKKLGELDDALKRHSLILQAHEARDMKENLLLTKKMLTLFSLGMVVFIVYYLVKVKFLLAGDQRKWFVLGITAEGLWLLCKLFWVLLRAVTYIAWILVAIVYKHMVKLGIVLGNVLVAGISAEPVDTKKTASDMCQKVELEVGEGPQGDMAVFSE